MIRHGLSRVARRFAGWPVLQDLAAELDVTTRRLYEEDAPAARAELYGRHAHARGRMYCLRPDASWAQDLLVEAALAEALAATERDLGRSVWIYGAHLAPKMSVLHDGQLLDVVQVDRDERLQWGLQLTHQGGRLGIDSDQRFRAAGPSRFRAVDLVRRAGACADECLEWYLLSTTRDRDRRAEALVRLARLVEGRVGPGGGRFVMAIAETELTVACGQGDVTVWESR